MRWLVVCAAAVLCFSCEGRPSHAPQVRAHQQQIVGGVDEPSHQYVVMVGDQFDGFCSGTLISKRTVITAGHCWDPGGITTIYFDTGSPLTSSTVKVASSVRHPQFDNNTLDNDLTIVGLVADAPVQPVPLLRETMANTPDFIGPKLTFAGYGIDNGSTGSGFGTRRVTVFPIMEIGPDANIVEPMNAPMSAVTSIVATQFYYRYPNKNTCNGDSGGPAFIVRNGVERHAGTTSYGDDFCVWDGVQQRTDATTMPWIQSQIDLTENMDPCRSDGTCNASCVSTAPAPLGTMTDPDCADQHCSADGVCVTSCFLVDPDCASMNVSNCVENGICQSTGCAVSDPDCIGLGNGQSCNAGSECASGICANGACCATACNGDCEACSIATGGTVDGTCTARSAGTVCRPDAGACDVTEKCDGVAHSCPADAFLPNPTICRPADGGCDLGELCTGASAQCPRDAFAPVNTLCRPLAGDCDAPEVCSGTTGECPADRIQDAGFTCRSAANSCDSAELCDGVSLDCPTDEMKPNGSLCSTGTCQAGNCTSGAGGGSGTDGGSGGGGAKHGGGCGCSTVLEPVALIALLALIRRRRR